MPTTINGNQITINVNDIVPPSNFATVDSGSIVGTVYTKVQDNEWRSDVESATQSGIKGVAKPDTHYDAITNPFPTPWTSGDEPLYEKYDVNLAGTYIDYRDLNDEDIIVTTNDIEFNDVQIWVQNGVALKVLKALPQASVNIRQWSDLQPSDFPLSSGSQIEHFDMYWKVADGQIVESSDVPGVSDKWIAIGNTILESTNLFKGEYINNHYISGNGVIYPENGWGYVRLPAKELTAYTFDDYAGLDIMVRYEDINEAIISAQGFFPAPKATITTPTGCEWVCANVKSSAAPNAYLNIKIYEGADSNPNEYMVKDEFQPVLAAAVKSKYQGMKGIALGDSVTEGTQGGWVNQVSFRLGATIQNFGSSGANTARMVEIINGAGGWNQYYQQYGNNGVPDFTNTDFVNIMIGHNESAATMGSLADIIDKPQNEYANTLVGNLAKSIEIILSQNVDCKIYVCTLHLTKDFNNTYDRSPMISEKLADVAKYYALPIIDVLLESNVNKKNINTMLYDATHLTVQGNKNVGKCIATGLIYK